MTRPPLHHDASGLDSVSPATHDARDAAPFRRILAARDAVAEADAELREAVRAARKANFSWAVIGAALDVSRQAAQQRFGQ